MLEGVKKIIIKMMNAGGYRGVSRPGTPTVTSYINWLISNEIMMFSTGLYCAQGLNDMIY